VGNKTFPGDGDEALQSIRECLLFFIMYISKEFMLQNNCTN